MLLLALIGISINAQNYSVDFHYEGAGGDLRVVYLMNVETNALIDSFDVSHERAHMEGTCAGLPLLAAVSTRRDVRNAQVTFILDNTPVTLECLSATPEIPMGTTTIQGSELNNRLGQTTAQVNAMMQKMYKVIADIRTATPAGTQPTEEQLKAYRAQAEETEQSIKGTYEALLQSERNNKLSLYCLVNGADFFDTQFLNQYLEGYAYADSPALANLRTKLQSARLREPGASYIDFEMSDQSGTLHKLSDFVGKGTYVMVDFWASWCGPCRQEMPNVKAAYERFHDKGFDIVAVSFDNNRDAWLKGIADLGMTWTQLSDLQGWNCLAGQIYKIRAIPCTIIYGPDGKVVASDLRGEALSKFLSEKLP